MIEECSSIFLRFLFTSISIHMDVSIHMAELLPKHFEYPAETFAEHNLMNTPYTYLKQIQHTCSLQTRKMECYHYSMAIKLFLNRQLVLENHSLCRMQTRGDLRIVASRRVNSQNEDLAMVPGVGGPFVGDALL